MGQLTSWITRDSSDTMHQESKRSYNTQLYGDAKRPVINISDQSLDAPTLSVLSKGLGFAPSPKAIPYIDFIVEIEPVIAKLPDYLAVKARAEVMVELDRAQPPQPNISKEEQDALDTLRRNEAVMVLPADKGNAIVLMNTKDYRKKVNDILRDGAYKKLPKDPTDSVARKTIKLIKFSGVPEGMISSLRPRAPAPPRLYGLPKIHEEGVTLTPIMSSIGSPTYNLEEYLAGLLSVHVDRCERHVKNSSEFVKNLSKIHLEDADVMVRLDVVSLFSQLPRDDTLKLLESRFDLEKVELFRHVFRSTYFKYDGEFYEMTDGLPMGSPLSPAVANFFMEYFEQKALAKAHWKPKCFLRSMNHTFIVWPHGDKHLETFLKSMNRQHPKIKFTMEKEKDEKIPFLDVLIHRRGDGTIGHSVYRDPNHSDLDLSGNSHHHPSQKTAIMSELILRAQSIADKESLPQELTYLVKTFRQNGFREEDISSTLRETLQSPKMTMDGQKPLARADIPFVSTVSREISRILKKFDIETHFHSVSTLKDQLVKAKDPCGLYTPGVYQIPCECGLVYIGRTAMTVATRVKEHQGHLRSRKKEKSAIAEHSILHDHAIQWDKTKVLHREGRDRERKIKESIEIRLAQNKFNRIKGDRLNDTWIPVLKKMQEERQIQETICKSKPN
ncbi:uncharacterized protein LOC124169549 [Ischnura elegans]|uniref:uncharacterized protein LOC124169549 n=1 Tax=Ischnura elegans TaxID=197161 RepID=UPI001ED86979|nr:uncharacterized protein LOC124169549 [Ischnura elegans]